MNFVSRLKGSPKQNISLIQGKTEKGLDCYYYLLIKPEKGGDLDKIAIGGSLKIEEFGTVLKKGYGEPTQAVKDTMLNEYGFNPAQ